MMANAARGGKPVIFLVVVQFEILKNRTFIIPSS